ncbi:hypothetical protein FJ946_30235 [Mesorhizobium sp. B2-4-7]|nr:hypothetical protein FJ946_30235 [Mesorhizobium sp. B2-4-7]
MSVWRKAIISARSCSTSADGNIADARLAEAGSYPRPGPCLQAEQKLNGAMQHLHHCYAKSAIQVPLDDDYLSIIETNTPFGGLT